MNTMKGLLIVLVTLFSFGVYGGILPYTRGLINTPASGSPQVIKNTSTGSTQTMITPPSNGLGSIDLMKKGLITFGVDHHYQTYMNSFTAQITLTVTRYPTLTGSAIPDTTIIMNVSYEPGNPDSLTFVDKQTVTFGDVEKFKMVITDIQVNGSSQSVLPANLYVQGDVLVDRVYEFSSMVNLTPYDYQIMASAHTDTDCDGQEDILTLSWNAIPGAEEYQLEWNYINDYNGSSGLTVNFRNNSTRITTTATSYDLSLIFDKGYVCFRVRAVGRSTSDPSRFLFSSWSTPDGDVSVVGGTINYQITQPFDISKNWQYSTTYAEEGKKKEVLSFYDGSLRNRQMVTKINSDHNTIVGETIYDQLGRPAIQVLPVPVNTENCNIPDYENSLKYYRNFNRNGSDVPYLASDFDPLNPTEACSPDLVPGMSTSEGASNYYSTANPVTSGSQGYVADGEQYPFSQVEYTPDNTGRIRRQGGVGEDFQLGSGHETNYFYAHPFQEQLDRLFGSEVGDASHYQKNMVVDPNGQVSVSYLDQEGRVIATSLAGEAPNNLEELPSAASAAPLNVDLLATDYNGNSSSNVLSPDGKSKVFNQTIALSSSSDVTIHYNMGVAAFHDSCLAAGVCFNCIYDLKIEVRDVCGTLLSPDYLSDRKTGHFTTDTSGNVVFSLTCDSLDYDTTFVLTNLPVGTYQISKILTVNEDAINSYIAQYTNDSLGLNTCVNDYDYFLNEQETNSNISDCDEDFSCAQCVADLGTLLDYLAAGGTEEEYNAELAACNAPCKPISFYETQRDILKIDVSPGGQYGEYMNNQGDIHPELFPLSVFNTANYLPKSNSYWRYPQYDIESTIQNYYFDEDGVTKSRIVLGNVTLSGTNVTASVPSVISSANVGTEVFWDNATSEYYTYPQYLDNVDDFINYYMVNPYWSNSLVYYHPEYPMLSIFRTFTEPVNAGEAYTSESFDQEMMSYNTWSDALGAGFLTGSAPYTTDYSSVSSLHPWDPFSAYVSTALSNKITNYLTVNSVTYSMMEVAAMITRCPNELIGYLPGASCTQFGTDFGSDPTENTQIRDAEWIAFRGMYISAKQEIQMAYAQNLALTNPTYYGYNECIGNDNFDAFDNGFLTFGSGFPFILTGQYFNSTQPCSIGNHQRYADKTIRFGNPSAYVDSDPMQVAYQMYLQTGQCPIALSFQNLLSQTSQQHLLESTGFGMNALSTVSALLMAIDNFEVSGPLPVLDWVQTTNSSSVLEVLWQESGTSYATFRLVKDPGSSNVYDWDDILSFYNLQFTQINSGLYEFTVDVKVNISGTIVTEHLTGNTTLKIGGCSFPDECVLNDPGKAMEKMLKLLAGGSQLTSTSYVTVSSSPYDVFYTSQFQHAVSPSSTGTTDFRYLPSLPGFEFVDGGYTLTLTINAVEPTTFSLSSMSLVGGITELIPGPNNTLRLVCEDMSGNYLATLDCDAIRSGGSGNVGIPFGNCGLGESVLCHGSEYQTFDDLKALFKDVFENQDPVYDLVSSVNWTTHLEGFLPSVPTSIVSDPYSYNGHNGVLFNLQDHCDLTLVPDYSGTLNYYNIVSVDEMHVSQPVASDGFYYSFYLLTTYFDGSSNVTVRFDGTSCLPLLECDNCNSDTIQQQSYTAEELSTITESLKIAGILEEDNAIISYVDYTTVVDQTNTRLGWSDTDPNYLVAVPYKDFYDNGLAYAITGYIEYAVNYVDGMDDYDLLKDPFGYIKKYGSGDNIYRSYDRYTQAVSNYNDARTALGYAALPVVDLWTFAQTIYSEDCSDYLNYLDAVKGDVATALAIDYYPTAMDAKIDDSDCKDIYANYYNAYQSFAYQQSINETCLDYQITMPLVPYQTFIDNNLCCSTYGTNLLQTYIQSFSDTTACPGPIPMLDDCNSPVEVDTKACLDSWNLYVRYIDTYNNSDWAHAHKSHLDLLYPNFKVFIQMGYCDCVDDYNQYLQTYITASVDDELPEPETIDEFCGPTEVDPGNTACQDAYIQYLNCVAVYNEKAMENSQEYVVNLVKMETFYESDLCYCVDAYCSELTMVLHGLKPFERMPDLYTFCKDRQEEPCVHASDTLVYETFEMAFDDPCAEFYESNIEVNAQINYNEQIQAFQTAMAQKYIAHCMSAVEGMGMTYNEIEHHFTLYYYDQAGNLIKTVPPEGVELVNISDPAVRASVIYDREFNTHKVITNHRMATTYLYNSLNQLVAQNMPDQDEMSIFEPTLPNGLPIALNTTAIQMVDANQGYLTGYISNTALPLQNRGYLYRTTNGGENWTRVSNMLGASIRELVFVSSTTGYAIAEEGTLLMTSDAGYNWDLMNTYGQSIYEDFVGLDKNGTDAYAMTKSGVIWKLSGTTVNSSPVSAPVLTGFGFHYFTDFTLQGSTPSTGTVLYIASATNNTSGLTYDVVISRTSGGTITLEKTQVLDLKTAGFYNTEEGLIAGDDGNLSHLAGTTNATHDQFLGKSGVTGTIDQLFMVNDQVGLARIDDNGTKVIRKTTDGGLTWNALQDDYADATLSLVKQGATSKEILLQGYDASSNLAYTKTIVLLTNGVISELNQTPNLAQNLELKAIAAYVNGSDITYFGVGSDSKLYQSNTITSTSQEVTFTQVTTAGTLTGTPQEMLVLKNGTNGVSVEILSSVGKIYRSASTSITGTYSSMTAITGATSIASIDKLTLGGLDHVLAYNTSDSRVYAKAATSSGALFYYNTTLTLGGSVIAKLQVHGTKVTLVGSKGGIFTSTAAIGSTPASNGSVNLEFASRANHGLTGLTSIRTNGSYVVITGENGFVGTRPVSASPAGTVQVRAHGSTEDFYESSYRVNASVNYYGVAGSNGYFTEHIEVSGIWTEQLAFYTTYGSSLAVHANGKAIRSIAVDGQKVYLVGDQGAVYYTSDITTNFFIPAAPSTVSTLRAAAVIPGASRMVAAGDQTVLIRYNANFGTSINNVYPGKLVDVHFENGQYGTVIGEHYFLRRTATGGMTWNAPTVAALAGAVSVNDLKKVWTKVATDGSHVALVGCSSKFLNISGNAIVSQGVIAPVSDIAFGNGNPLSGYFAVSGALYGVTLTPTTSNYTVAISGSSLYSSANAIYGLHVFDNGSVVMVGASGSVRYYNQSTTSSYTLATISGAPTLRDVYFHDNKVGYAVGDGGKFYHLYSADNDNVTHDILSTGFSYTQELTLDPVLNNNTGYNIVAIAFNTRSHAVYGGSYTSSGDVTGKPAFVRSLKQEGNLYTARFYYDRLGRIVVSQNSRQLADNKFSYTLYDPLGRVYEAGEKTENTTASVRFNSIFGTYVGGSFVPTIIDDSKLSTWLSTEATTTRKEVTHSYYDVTVGVIGTQLPVTLNEATQRKRIVHVTYEEVYDNDASTYDHATHYDYDIHGNVKTLIQDNRKLESDPYIARHRFKRLDYVYDLISGNVHRVDYATGNADQWHHVYNYDADNRITEAFTSTETPLTTEQSSIASLQNEPQLNPLWDQEVAYTYYAHGPLARTVLGAQQVQGIDYVYTLQGWIKSVNSNTLDPNRDPGEDGKGLSANHYVARDVYGYSLHYFDGDYAGAIGGNNSFVAAQSGSDLTANSSDLYNGNIARMVTTITDPNTRDVLPLGNAYRYDQLNRLKESRSFNNLDVSANSWGSGSSEMYYNAFEYDANGNITYQMRQDEAGYKIDDMTYYYENTSGSLDSKHNNAAMKVKRNRLHYVDDLKDYDDNDIDPGMNPSNYKYDGEGRLIADAQEEIERIIWRVDGKVKNIIRSSGSHKKNVSFDYDAMGHRIAKHVYSSDNIWERSTYYVLDAQGNAMAVYEHVNDEDNHVITFNETEKHIYGSSRLGMHNEHIPLFDTQNKTYSMTSVQHHIGDRTYELSNHLGNVLSVISDKPIPHDNSGTVDYFQADIRHAQDYSPFGVTLHKRDISLTTSAGTAVPYRYGFQNQEEDPETGLVNYKYRMHDPRLGRFFAIDPLTRSFPWYSSYQFGGNRPIDCVELEGAEPKSVVDENGHLTETAIKILTALTNVDKSTLETVQIMHSSDNVFHAPWYRKGGGLTVGSTIYLTNNYYTPANGAQNTNKYGGDDLNAVANWFYLLSHEVGHLPQANAYGTDKLGIYSYLGSFISGYVARACTFRFPIHDGLPMEITAELGAYVFESIFTYTDSDGNRSINGFGVSFFEAILNNDQQEIDRILASKKTDIESSIDTYLKDHAKEFKKVEKKLTRAVKRSDRRESVRNLKEKISNARKGKKTK